MPFYSDRAIRKGIENLIRVPSGVDSNDFTSTTEKINEYGISSTIRTFDKTRFCDFLIEKSRAGECRDLFEDFRDLFDELRSAVDYLTE